ncbi:GCN5-related N-acetyltransferase (fragment) [Cupriavidus necator]|uniref:GCN5-related N-acetyltransferase n=1 Tax=Cupriavidus necator TaxID=106590 RepID=A0A1K0JKS1_CUPNE
MKLRDATADDLAAIEALLHACELPAAGVAEHIGNFVVVDDPEGGLVACAGLECYGDSALLRSVAVAEVVRGGGVAASMVARLLEDCRARGISNMALLTVSA